MFWWFLAFWLVLVHVLAVMHLLGKGKASSSESGKAENFTGDLAAAQRIADYFRWSGEISAKHYRLIRGLLIEAKYKGVKNQRKGELPQQVAQRISQTKRAALPSSGIAKPSETVPGLTPSAKDAGTGEAADDIIVTASLVDQPSAAPNSPVIPDKVPSQNQPVDSPLPLRKTPQAKRATTQLAASEGSKNPPAKGFSKPAPWDFPDSPKREPQKTFAEVMSAFMQEKNMRWGELASGIMIVLSAVGLVVSLRETLEDTVPYFSALLFMLITAAIHGAGIYTLKKWKLRNTSRGTLVIGLLLVPINFVMACVLSDHRPLSDPWFWVAVITGLSVFSFLTWYSSKALLRRGNLPMVVAIMGCGIGSLILNRTIDSGFSDVFSSLFALPILVSFVIGSCTFDPLQWKRQHWTSRSQNRLWLFFGIAFASAIFALSIGVFRPEMNLERLVVFTPILSVIFLTMFRFGAQMHAATVDSPSSLPVGEREPVPLYGLSIKVLGLLLLGISLAGALSNPTMFLLNSLLVATGLFVIIVNDQTPRLLPFVYGLLAAAAVVGVNLFFGTFAWEETVLFPAFVDQIVSGMTGLLLLFLGVCVGLGNVGLKRIFPSEADSDFNKRGWIAASGIFLVGLVMALVASGIHREDGFSTGVASGLLMLGAVGLLAVTFRANDSPLAIAWQLPVLSVLGWLGALVHLVIWDLSVASMVPGLFAERQIPWMLIAVLTSGLLTALVLIKPLRPCSETVVTTGETWLYWAITGVLCYSLGVLSLVPLNTEGWGTGFALVACLNWFCIGLAIRRLGSSLLTSASIPVFSGGVLAVFIFLSEFGSHLQGFPVNTTTDYWLAISTGLIIYWVAWTIVTTTISRWPSWTWLSKNNTRVINFLLYGLIVAITMMALDGVSFGVSLELGTGLEGPVLPGGENFFWLFLAIGVAAFSVGLGLVVRPQPIGGYFAFMLWFLGWALVSVNFIETASVASAIRWLMAVGGILVAGLLAVRKPLLPIWAALRNALSLSGKSFWGKDNTQVLINFSLTLSTLVVLWISTIVFFKLIVTQTPLEGPAVDSLFFNLMPEISYGVPILLVVSTFLVYAVSESRPLLATIGSSVFQYLMLLAIVLIVFAEDFGLASTRFVNLLLAVSMGMTVYGVVWYFLRNRIDVNVGNSQTSGWITQGGRLSQLKIHVLLNGLLIACLAGMVIINVFLKPEDSGLWINRIGGWGGILAWLLFGGLVFFVYRNAEVKQLGTTTLLWFVGLMGTIFLGLFAAMLDRHLTLEPWIAFRVISCGLLAITFIQVYFLGRGVCDLESEAKEVEKSLFEHQFALAMPLYFSAALAMTFVFRGIFNDVSQLPIYYYYLGAIGLLSICFTQAGWVLRLGLNGFVSLLIALAGVTIFVGGPIKPWLMLDGNWINLAASVSALLAILWSGYYLLQRKQIAFPNYFLIMPNCVMIGGMAWIMFASLMCFLSSVIFGAGNNWLNNPMGYLALLSFFGLAVTSIWNDRTALQTTVFYLFSVAVGLTIATHIRGEWLPVPSIALQLLLGSLLVTFWSMVWIKRILILKLLASDDSLQSIKLEKSLATELPICNLIFGSLMFCISFLFIATFGERSVRYIAVFTPFSLAIATGVQANQTTRRYLQIVSIAFVTIGVIFLALADLSPDQMYAPFSHMMVRILIVLSAAMFVYGFLVTRWVRAGDTWLESLKTMSVVTCGFALIALITVLSEECLAALNGGRIELLLSESIVVAIMVAAMIVGLVTIAVRPRQDPFSLTLEGRMGYVYAAEFCVALLILHVMLSMPWLLDFGLREYWPYITMAICFGGVGVSELLKKRQLEVLSIPLFNTAAVFPVVVAMGIFTVASAADTAMVILMVGMIYLMISVINKSLLSAGLGVVFGNLALWVFFDQYEFSLMENPQLWLIPPAISTLIAAQLYSQKMSVSQLAGIRYFCIAVIYVSSTMEIFISGIGESLAPPIILAVLSLAGIMAGIILRIKAFLYFGTLFLFMAMLSMVAHAQQALGHVWPWWAFGIGTGIAILVMFGMIEKRKNDLDSLKRNPEDSDS